MALINIYPKKVNIRICFEGKDKPSKQLLLSINNITGNIMDITLAADKGSIKGHLVVKDNAQKDLPVTGTSYSSTDENVFSVSGDDSGYSITPNNPGTATFNFGGDGLTGSATITVTPGSPATIDNVVDQPQA